jgi:hypothetical protein
MTKKRLPSSRIFCNVGLVRNYVLEECVTSRSITLCGHTHLETPVVRPLGICSMGIPYL